MSFKAVDLQLAVHKNMDVGLMQHKLQQQPVQDQALLGAQAVSEAEHRSRQTERLEQRSGGTIRKRQQQREAKDGKRGQASGAPAAKAEKKRGAASVDDPHKGRHIDFSL